MPATSDGKISSEKKRKTNAPTATLKLDTIAKDAGKPTTKIIKTIKCGLRRAIINNETEIILDDLAKRLGVHRYFVSLFSNYLLMKLLEEEVELPQLCVAKCRLRRRLFHNRSLRDKLRLDK